jgi:transposase
MAACSKTGTEVVMVGDRRGIHRAHKLDATLDHYHGKFRLHFLPAHCGHHLNPIEGFWRVMKDAIGAGAACPSLLLSPLGNRFPVVIAQFWALRNYILFHNEL